MFLEFPGLRDFCCWPLILLFPVFRLGIELVYITSATWNYNVFFWAYYVINFCDIRSSLKAGVFHYWRT